MWRRKLLVLTVATAATLLALEAGVRLLSPIEPALHVDHPTLGKIYVPGLERASYVPEAGRRVLHRINREGFRDRDRPEAKPEGTRRLALIGDSMIAAMATDEEATAARVLERLLREADPGAAWDVLNLGISGSSTGNELVVQREVAARYDPDLVVLAFYTGNDFGDNSRELTSSRHRVYFELDERGGLARVPRSGLRARAAAWLAQHSRFYLWQQVGVKAARDGFRERFGGFPDKKLVYWNAPAGAAERAWEVLERLLVTLRAEVEDRGGALVVAVLPAAEQLFDENWGELLERAGERREELDPYYPEQRLRSIAERNGIRLLTMLDAFRAAAPHRSRAREDEWLHYAGRGHFNAAGNRLAAELIARYLIEQGLVGSGEVE